MHLVQRWRLRAERTGWRLDQPRVLRAAMWLVPLLFGLLSVAQRQDSNWDLRNYHLYNPFAFLNGKVGLDLAPAQMQTYFNPTIDLLYYALIKTLPAPLAGFVMGVVHGLNFIFVAGIARAVLPDGRDGSRAGLPLLLALAGMLSASFLSGLGTSMGDNLSALFVLGALWMLLLRWPQLLQTGAAGVLLGAGAVMGLGVGLKLTVAVFALALCLALLALPLSLPRRARAAFLFGLGVLLGMAVTGGHWHWKMATLFGNPLFPQFNNIFQGPLAGAVAVADTHFLPHGLAEHLLWPFLVALDPSRVSQIQVGTLAWPLLYLACAALTIKIFVRRHAGVPDARVRMLLLFLVLSYASWMVLFSIYRYLAPLELLAPLLLYLLMQALLPRVVAGKAAAVLIVLVIASSVPMGNWGHAGWHQQSARAEVPVIADPAHSIVFSVNAMPASGWLATFFPAELAFASLAPGFPVTAGYRARVASMLATRKNGAHVLVEVTGAQAETGPVEAARGLLASYQLAPDTSRCAAYPAYLGRRAYYYQLCPLHALPQSPSQSPL
jgi:hypothetical protein